MAVLAVIQAAKVEWILRLFLQILGSVESLELIMGRRRGRGG
jgi:hypothetical protein